MKTFRKPDRDVWYLCSSSVRNMIFWRIESNASSQVGNQVANDVGEHVQAKFPLQWLYQLDWRRQVKQSVLELVHENLTLALMIPVLPSRTIAERKSDPDCQVLLRTMQASFEAEKLERIREIDKKIISMLEVERTKA